MAHGPETLTPIVSGWKGKIKLAEQARKWFTDIADQCMAFYAGPLGYFWKPEFQKKFVGGTISPKFRITLSKAFELRAIFGPVLYHRNPYRAVRPYQVIQFEPWVFGDPNDPQVQQTQQQVMTSEAATFARNDLRCKLMERYLSFTPGVQPAGGLEEAAIQAITEGLIKGRGLLWPQTWKLPMSSRRLTGCFYDSVDRLLLDPDAKSHHFGECKWIAREHFNPTWEVERMFNLKKDALKDKGTFESGNAKGAKHGDPLSQSHTQQGKTFDSMRWWEIFSIGGVGTRLSGADKWMGEAFDDVVGDYAYVVIGAGLEYPLNCPPAEHAANIEESWEAADDETIKRLFSWPIPFWLKKLWPCAFLDFYGNPDQAWPISPLAPALGELTALNIILSELINSVWAGSRTFIACAESIADKIEKVYNEGKDLAVFRLPQVIQSIEKTVSFLRAPDVSVDRWHIIEQLFELVDKRTGLSDLHYGLSPGGAASRSATDIAAKQQNLSVRPDDMAKRVASFMSEAAEMEKLCAFWGGIGADDVRPHLGDTGAYFWKALVEDEDPDVVLHQMTCTVEASDVRKPNKERDAQNMAQLYQPMSQQFGQYAALTTDTKQQNNLNRLMCEAIDQPFNGLEMGPMAPPQPPPGTPTPQDMEMQAMQQKMQMEQQAGQQKIAESQQQMQIKAVDQSTGLQMKAAETTLKLKAKEAETRQALQQKQLEFAQTMMQDAQAAELKLKLQEEAAAAKAANDRKKPVVRGK